MTPSSSLISSFPRSSLAADRHDLESIREAIAVRYGFCLNESSFGILGARITTRASSAGLSCPDYLASLLTHRTSPRQEEELALLAESLLIGETHFLRTEPHFAALAGIVVTTWRTHRAPRQRLRIASLGCSTGEEPYSIAITLRENLLPNEIEDVEITGVDVNRKALAVARKGLYDNFQLRDIPPARRQRWFAREGNSWRIHPTIRESVRFLQHNIIHPLPFAGLDLVFCRNVLIYFRPAQVADCLSEIHAALHQGGFLILGHSESGLGFPELFEPITVPDGVIYRKRSLLTPNP